MNLSRIALAMLLFVGADAATSDKVLTASDLADEIRAWNGNNVLVSDELSRRLSVPTSNPITLSPTTASGPTFPTFSVITPGSFSYNGVDCSTISQDTLEAIESQTVTAYGIIACIGWEGPPCQVTSKATCTEASRKLVRGERRLATDILEVRFNITTSGLCQQNDCSDAVGAVSATTEMIKGNLRDLAIVDVPLPQGIQNLFPALNSANATATVLADVIALGFPPTPAPTGSPTVPAPTGSPTPAPTPAPTGSPTSAAIGSLTAPKGVTDPTQVKIIVPGSIKYTGADCSVFPESSLKTIEAMTVTAFNAVTCSPSPPYSSSNCVPTVEATCTEAWRKLVRGERRLATDTLEILFNITFTSYCQQGDCSDVQDIISSVESKLQVYRDRGDLDDFAKISLPYYIPDLDSLPATVVLENSIVPMLEDLLNWYPDWHSGTNTCKNDGEYPFYMSRQGSYFRSTLKDCCKYYYGWAYNECLDLGGGNTADLASDKFYANYDAESCAQDCPEGTTGKNCGGLVKGNWVVLYSTASECCKGKFWWTEENVCIGKSTQNQTAIDVANAGSGKYYIDWEDEKCVKDCAKSATDAACGGLANKWDPLYTSASVCCSTKLAWKDRDECTR